MLKSVIVLSRDEVEQYIPDQKEVCISIRSNNSNYPHHGDSDRIPVLSDKFVDVLSLQFDDIIPTVTNDFNKNDWVPMSSDHGNQVEQFVSVWRNDAEKLVIHCYGGVSRSRSMAAAICKSLFMKHEYDVFNKWVYDITLNAFQK